MPTFPSSTSRGRQPVPRDPATQHDREVRRADWPAMWSAADPVQPWPTDRRRWHAGLGQAARRARRREIASVCLLAGLLFAGWLGAVALFLQARGGVQ